jgi:hypothetical protein
MASTEPNSDERERNGPHPLQNAFDALPLEVPEGAVRAAGRGLNAAGQAFEAGVRLAASGAGEIVGRAGDLAGDAARAGLDVASNVDLGGLAGAVGDVAEVAGEGLGEVAGAVIEGLGSISS